MELVAILNRRLAEGDRKPLAAEIQKAPKESWAAGCTRASPEELFHEAGRIDRILAVR
jgi:hypothetical protein